MSDLSIFDLTGRKALVTGAAGGIGKACAVGMAKAGADVAIIDLKDEMGSETVQEIKALGRSSFFVHCDVTDIKQVEDMVRQVVDEFGRLDIAFNNAGTTSMGGKTIEDASVDIYHNTIANDLHSIFYCCREEAKYMIPQRYGKIINTASTAATTVPNMPAWATGITLVSYCAAKAGVKQLTKALAIEWAEYNICVNLISPGPVTTAITQVVRDIPEILEHENATIPMHRQGEAEEMVGGVLYLASDASSFTTGHDLIMDGGYTVW
ncbi:MAG: SDR family oxidoreductase [Deltaproteobacteria bacterium]|nr:SDR family oxidoreductase [Deltaproteobacteria bacterium]